MSLKNLVDGLLKEKNRSLSWLAEEMHKTFDGLKLSLVKGSLKYNDIVELAKILEVPPAVFFQAEPIPEINLEANSESEIVAESKEIYRDLKACKEMLAALKDQLKDKEMIISLLNKDN